MGVDCLDICQIIHLGPAEDVESYARQTGRAGRDGKPACALLLYRKSRRLTDEGMVEYGTNASTCRRDILFTDFDNYKHIHNGTLCMCCDIFVPNAVIVFNVIVNIICFLSLKKCTITDTMTYTMFLFSTFNMVFYPCFQFFLLHFPKNTSGNLE